MKHSSPQFAAIAEDSTILRVQVGSGVHGTAIQGQDDRDEQPGTPRVSTTPAQ